ncbi:Ras-related protein RABC1 [Morella rubra]|uniref:Ras-related protein RABC1 n=1 Tax=Morella rubra TaxID=262757 RepID=A0A6A1WRC9_9ROSI|nr:Ras-related protein RABC1 [Morella rubra]
MLVGNKSDKESERLVSRKEGIDFAKENGCLFRECSAKTGFNLEPCFQELVSKILETPSLLNEPSAPAIRQKAHVIVQQTPPKSDDCGGCCC